MKNYKKPQKFHISIAAHKWSIMSSNILKHAMSAMIKHEIFGRERKFNCMY